MVRKTNAGRAALDKPKRPEGPKRIGNRLYLMSKKDADIKKRRDAISKKAIKLHSMLDEMRLKRKLGQSRPPG